MGGAEGAEENEYEDEVICGQYEKPPVKIVPDPGMPTQKEIDERYVAHLPHRSWCEVCIKARGREDAHASQKD